MPSPKRHDVSPQRKLVYYSGMALMAVGGFMFLSTFFDGPKIGMSHGAFGVKMEETGQRAITGMIVLAVGGLLMAVGRMGAAGSGLLLNPRRARKDLEPWARMGGGMVGDALEEANLKEHLGGGGAKAKEVVKVRCGSCRTLNDEDAKFCDECGQAM